MSTTVTRTELAQRRNDSIEVTLLWSRDDGSVVVHVHHLPSGKHAELAVEPERALEAYYHPFAYTPTRRKTLVPAAA